MLENGFKINSAVFKFLKVCAVIFILDYIHVNLTCVFEYSREVNASFTKSTVATIFVVFYMDDGNSVLKSSD